MGIMASALFFGFLHLFVTDGSLQNYERLHIFLFNLCSGGTILIFYTEDSREISKKALCYLALSLLYAILAFLKHYQPAIITAFILAVIVDSVRIRKFSVFPVAFFKAQTPVAEKFHQAALLCLSCALVVSGLVILNDEYLMIVSFPKLKLDTFFLGFSFPLSLITMSVIFLFMPGDFSKLTPLLKNAGFWIVNLGVIIFFGFILSEQLTAQLAVTSLLFLCVVMILYLYARLGIKTQQKNFLTSGIFFLLYTAITGIIYIALEFSPDYPTADTKFLLRMHSFASLYGWNLSGLAVICRQHDFPIQLHSGTIITVHWITAIFLAPLGTCFRPFAVAALICYIFILYMILFSKGAKPVQNTEQKQSAHLISIDRQTEPIG
jgi:type IV secretory pathway VirB3-like protein